MQCQAWRRVGDLAREDRGVLQTSEGFKLSSYEFTWRFTYIFIFKWRLNVLFFLNLGDFSRRQVWLFLWIACHWNVRDPHHYRHYDDRYHPCDHPHLHHHLEQIPFDKVEQPDIWNRWDTVDFGGIFTLTGNRFGPLGRATYERLLCHSSILSSYHITAGILASYHHPWRDQIWEVVMSSSSS